MYDYACMHACMAWHGMAWHGMAWYCMYPALVASEITSFVT